MQLPGVGTACSGSFLEELVSRLSEIKTKEKELLPRKRAALSKRRKREISREESLKNHSRSVKHSQSEDKFHKVAIILSLHVNESSTRFL